MTAPAPQEAFHAARRRALVQDVVAELSGRSDELLSFEQVRQHLRLSQPTEDPSLQEIPLDRIVGSVGRYRDFNRAFLPRGHVDPDRWTRIRQLQTRIELPPIDVFQVGDVFFVRDGNHRVSAARSRGQATIAARVVTVPVRVPLHPDTSPDDLILKSGYAEFLEETALDRECPDQYIELTRAGGYRSLLQHVEVHQFYMGLRSRRFPTVSEAAADWYRGVYLPVVERVRESGILKNFPGRTEADLYLWIAENRARLQMRYRIEDQAKTAVDSFTEEYSAPTARGRIRARFRQLLARWLPLQPKPPR